MPISVRWLMPRLQPLRLALAVGIFLLTYRTLTLARPDGRGLHCHRIETIRVHSRLEPVGSVGQLPNPQPLAIHTDRIRSRPVLEKAVVLLREQFPRGRTAHRVLAAKNPCDELRGQLRTHELASGFSEDGGLIMILPTYEDKKDMNEIPHAVATAYCEVAGPAHVSATTIIACGTSSYRLVESRVLAAFVSLMASLIGLLIPLDSLYEYCRDRYSWYRSKQAMSKIELDW